MSFAWHLSNGIPIASFTGEKDEELLFMTTMLEELFSKYDVRAMLEHRFKLGSLMV